MWQKKLGILLLVAFLSSCTQKPVVYDGATWGMSIDDVKGLYKTESYGNGIDELEYRTLIPGLGVDADVTYKFDARTGLKEIEVSTDDISGKVDFADPAALFRGEEITRLANTDEHLYFDTTYAQLADEAYNLPDPVFNDFRFVYDRIYTTPTASIRARLVCQRGIGGYRFYDKVTFLPPGWTWRDKPSDLKTAARTKSR